MARLQHPSRRQVLKSAAALAALPSMAYATKVLAPLVQPDVAQAATVSVENANLRIGIDTSNGAITSIYNKVKSIELVAVAPASPLPWRIEVNPGDNESSWITASGSTFSYVTNPDSSLTLTWVQGQLTVTATIAVPTGSLNAQITCAVNNAGTGQVSVLEYPVIQGIQRLSTAANGDYLAHPFATGYLFTNPYDLFSSTDSSKLGIPFGPYPDGYNGPAMQWMAYYAQNQGGFYLSTQDGANNPKWLDFFKEASTGNLFCRFRHACPNIYAGNSFAVTYPTLIGALSEGNWYEPAERYRSWATNQVWAQRGPLYSRTDRSTWLLEKVGFCTFGINAEYDRSTWINYMHAIAGTPVFHILGPNWQKSGVDYLGNTPGGRDQIFPPHFSASTVSAIKTNGDYLGAFSFNLLYRQSDYGADRLDGQAVQQQVPRPNTMSRDSYNFEWMCPVPSLATDISSYRDSQAVSTVGINAAYYDISLSNSMKICTATNHGHAKGGGPQLIAAYRGLLAQVKALTTKANGGTYVPLGTEVIVENFIGELDFYQARGEACPVANFESYWFRDWIKAGTCAKIPAFAYVYHDYGPVRLDGWGKLSAEQGDLFYWIAARVLLWGGLFELNYEFSSMETVNGMDDEASQSYFPLFIERHYAVDTAKTAFLSNLATARTGFAQPYVVYGTMLRPVPPNGTPPTIGLSWFSYNEGPGAAEYQDSGTYTVSSVIASAYRYQTQKAGFLYVNLQTTAQTIQVTLNPTAYGLTTSGLHVYQVTAAGSIDLGAITGATTYTVSLPSRQVLLLEMR